MAAAQGCSPPQPLTWTKAFTIPTMPTTPLLSAPYLNEGLHARGVNALAASELLELLVRRLDAVHAHHRLHRLDEHSVNVERARAASLRVTLLRPRRSAW